MKKATFWAALCAGLLSSTCLSLAQDDSAAVKANAYPYAPAAGVDSHADKIAPKGAVNQGAFNDKTWVFGHAWDAPPNTPLWNPVKVKMLQGGKITSVTVNGNDDPAVYCAAANSGVDFIWTEMQHSAGTWNTVQKMWNACPHAKAVAGVRIPNANEFDEQHALDMGASVLIVPTVRSLEEAKLAVKWAYFPPLGERSRGQSTAAFANVPGGYRNTANDNIVLILMIETLDGLQDVDKIAALPGVSAVFAASSDLGNFAGYKAGDPDYEREINMVHDAALRAHKYLCGPWTWVNRPDFNCFQGPGGTNDAPGAGGDLNSYFANRAKKDLGPLWNTQGKVTAGPYAPAFVEKSTTGRGGGGGG